MTEQEEIAKKIWSELNSKEKTIVQLKFYADLKGQYRNKLFCFNVETWEEADGIYNSFLKNGNRIRALFLTSNKEMYKNDELLEWNCVQFTKKDENGNLFFHLFYVLPDRVILKERIKK